MRVVLVGIGGMLGAIARYAAGGLVHRMYPGRFPLGTLLINIAGCFALGLLATLATDRGVLSASTRIFLFIGVLGGFTTFSSFGYETLVLWQDGLGWAAFLNVAASMVLGLGAVWAGHACARLI